MPYYYRRINKRYPSHKLYSADQGYTLDIICRRRLNKIPITEHLFMSRVMLSIVIKVSHSARPGCTINIPRSKSLICCHVSSTIFEPNHITARCNSTEPRLSQPYLYNVILAVVKITFFN